MHVVLAPTADTNKTTNKMSNICNENEDQTTRATHGAGGGGGGGGVHKLREISERVILVQAASATDVVVHIVREKVLLKC